MLCGREETSQAQARSKNGPSVADQIPLSHQEAAARIPSAFYAERKRLPENGKL
jgi:hypothetical protein